MGRPHLVVVPFPAQGHVMPLMELSHNLVDRGFKITFVNTEVTHKRVVDSLSSSGDYEDSIQLVCLPDGMDEGEDRNQIAKVIEVIGKVMPGHLENLIKKINESNSGDDKITCVIADGTVGWALEVAQKLSIRSAAFCPSSSVVFATLFHIPKLIQDGIISADGNLVKKQMIQLSPTMPAMNTAHFFWLTLGDQAFQNCVFDMAVRNIRALKLADHLLCNSFYELEPSAFSLVPNLRPIGPLFASSRLAHFWPEDSTCLSWLDQQQVDSVIYVAFGSIAVLDKRQFDELALGLELSGQPFLWAVRPDLTNGVTNVYPEGFEVRVGSRGRMVAWSPQREVLAHPSVGGFLTHCGWNSTVEGLTHGIPLLCWPYFNDQILNKSYICDVWRNGLGVNPDVNGLITREEIKAKVVRLLGDKGIKASVLKWKEMAMKSVGIGGKSLKNFEDFVQAIN